MISKVTLEYIPILAGYPDFRPLIPPKFDDFSPNPDFFRSEIVKICCFYFYMEISIPFFAKNIPISPKLPIFPRKNMVSLL